MIMSNSLETLIKGKEKFFKNKKTVIQKSNLINMYEDAIKNLSQNVLPVCEKFLSLAEDNSIPAISKKTLDNVGEVKVTLKYLKTSDKTVYGYFKNTLVPNLKNLVEQSDKIRNVLINNFPTVATSATFTVKELSVVNFVDNITFFSSFTLDLIDFIIETCRIHSGSLKTYSFNKKILEMIRNNMNPFILTTSECNKDYITKFIKSLPHASEVIVEEVREESPELVKRIVSEQGDVQPLLNVNNFFGNPIYHIGMWISDLQHRRYEYLKEKRARFNLTITQLELEKDGVNDAAINDQIAWYREREEEMAYKISKYENS